MDKNYHPLKKIWDSYPNFNHHESTSLKVPSIERLIAEMFAIGKFYYYVINISDGSLSNHHENILKMHGLKSFPTHLNEIIDLIHPDDIAFVMEAERMCYNKMNEIDGFTNLKELKSSYCFRMKVEGGNYEMFHHQALHTLIGDEGKLLQTVNIHTNVSHLMKENPYTALISGIGNRKDFHLMYYNNYDFTNRSQEQALSKREIEILSYIAQGYSASKISKILNISFYTVRTHRKNILQKTNSRNTSELMKKCFQRGLI